MSVRNLPTDEHLLDLLALRAVEGLDRADEAEAAAWNDPEVFDETAAMIALSLVYADGVQPMPSALRARLERMGDQTLTSPPPAPLPMVQTPSPGATQAGGRAIGWLGAIGWLAAAACLAMAVLVWNPTVSPPTHDQRLAVLETKPGILRTAWVGLDQAGLSEQPHAYDRGLAGEVVWDPETNEGYMVFEGLASNDPAAFQYQLWIFDESRPTGQLPRFGEGILSQRPVDGGVFDVLADGRVVVPVHAKLPVGKAAIFAVTVEPPGGVVVSDRDIVTLALVN